ALAAALAPAGVFTALFGTRFGDVAAAAPAYLVAMAALGVGRVLAAERCARHGPWAAVALLTLAAVVQAVLVTRADSAAGVVQATLAATCLLVGTLAVVPLVRPVPRRSLRLLAGAATRLRRPDVAAVAGLTVAALAVRLAVDRGLWVDEAISVELARRPLGAMLDQMRSADVHPPLHAVVLWLTVRVAGFSELAVRLPSILAGTALVPALWLTGRSLYDRRTGLVAAALGAVAPLLVWYSQEARMYAFFMLFAVLAVWAQVAAVRRGRTVHWLAYAAATAALVWTQYFGALVVAVQQAAFAAAVVLAWRRGDRPGAARIARGWVLSGLAVAAALAPLAPLASDQLAAYSDRRAAAVPSTAGAGATSAVNHLSIYVVLANVVWALVGFHADRTMSQIVALWPLAMMVALLVLGRRRSGATTLLVAVAVVPAIVLFVVGTNKRDLFELRYFAAAAPVAVLLGARLLALVTRGRWALRAVTALAVAVLALGLVDQQLNGANPRLYDFRGAIGEIRQRAEPGDTILYAPSYLATVVDYYGDDVTARPLGSTPPAGGGVFVVATFRTIAERDTAAEVGTQLTRLERDHRLVGRFDRANVRVWELR
ncbi:MAG: glycosyltransferase family 39 protein, partial [Acidimicrobiales bacterium]